jgi:hypothetical protein
MNAKKLFVSVLMLVALSLSACSMIGGTSPVALGDLPAYPGRIADTLAKNGSTDAAMRNAVGVGGKTEQRGFSASKDTTWDAVKKFYDDKLTSTGWGAPAGNAITNNILSQVNQQNDMFQTVIYSRGKQTLSVIRLADPISKEVTLILSLTTNP